MDSKATPGPWRLHKHTVYTGTMNTPDARAVGHIDGFSDANARLIAAAPALLAALEAMSDYLWRNRIKFAHEDQDYVERYEQARAAIRKAKGVE